MKSYVLLSDIHYNLQNLELSDYSLHTALKYAAKEHLPLIVAGDLHDTKALMRAECITRIIKTLAKYKNFVKVYILVGNHDRLNEKNPEHSLEFLRTHVTKIIEVPEYIEELQLNFIPYCETKEKFLTALNNITHTKYPIIVHQGFVEANMGHYMQDNSAVSINDVTGYRIISGHYHLAQNIGTVTYIGSPFTMSFGEANQFSKGFVVLDNSGIIQRHPLNLRVHRKLDITYEDLAKLIGQFSPEDLVSLTINCTLDEASLIPKDKEILKKYLLVNNLSINLVYTNSKESITTPIKVSIENQLDTIIDTLVTNIQDGTDLKHLWRNL